MGAWIEVLILKGDFHVCVLQGIVYLEDGLCGLQSSGGSRNSASLTWEYWWVDVYGELGGGIAAVWHANVYLDPLLECADEWPVSYLVGQPRFHCRAVFPPVVFWHGDPPSYGWLQS